MKKYLLFVLALAVALSIGAPAMAKQGASVGVSFGLLSNAGQLANTIVDDGLSVDLANPAAAGAYDTLTLIEAEDSLSDAKTKGTITDLKTSGPMSAMSFGLQARYDAFNFFFARLGFDYSFKVMGGETSWKKAGVEQSQTWDYSDMSIPLTLGINLPLADGKANVYFGFTVAYMSGEWSVELKRNYMNSVTTFGSLVVSPAIAAGVKEKVTFEQSGMGMGYIIGVDAEVHENVNIFVEIETLVNAGMNEYKVKSAAMNAVGITLFNKYTVIGGSYMKFGAKYNLGFAM
jgi:hypothetical protein